MVGRGEDPTGLAFEICDERLGPVIDLPFREAINLPSRPWVDLGDLRAKLREELRQRALISAQIREGIAEARDMLLAIHRTLKLMGD
ncbi:MAG TPA: hypothetical protein VKT30_17120 [Caulobacteraceae bacterium]|nr:hypothetical protein [Caulobacteraceae bacterium]